MTTDDKWVNLFREKIENVQSIEILQTIDVGYNSTVYLMAVDGQRYAVKMYHARYNGTHVCLTERYHITRARQSIPAAVPPAIFCSAHTENEFHREILIMEGALGVPLTNDVFNERIFEDLITVLTKLHRTHVNTKPHTDELERLDTCSATMLQFLKEHEVIPREKASHHLSALREYYLTKKPIFNRRHTIIHGDLWWDNILVDHGHVTIVDWLDSSIQDYCRDLAQFKIGTLNEILNTKESQTFFEKIVNVYINEFKDATIIERMRYYLPLMFLEESFYLPFKFFPWEIKYREDAHTFLQRFLDYYERSERFFRCGI